MAYFSIFGSDARNTSPGKSPFLLLIVVLSLTGCGRAARTALDVITGSAKRGDELAEQATKHADDVGPAEFRALNPTEGLSSEWLDTYLATRIPIAARITLARQRLEKGEFQVLPSRIHLVGTMSGAGNVLPAYATIQTKKACGWTVESVVGVFTKGDDPIVETRHTGTMNEQLDAMAVMERMYSETIILPSYVAKDGKIVEETAGDVYAAVKTTDGVRVTFNESSEAVVRSAVGSGDILFPVESDRFTLEMMKRGTNSYSYMLLDTSLPQFHSREDVVVTQYPNSDKFDGIRLWHRETQSHELVKGVWQESSKMTEIVDSLGIALYFRADYANDEHFEMHLEEVEFREPEAC